MNFIVPKCRDKELDLLLTGACPAIVREGNAKSQSAKRATDIKNKKNKSTPISVILPQIVNSKARF